MVHRPKLKILIVDDNPSFVKLFVKLFTTHFQNNFESIDTAENGQACIQKVLKNPYDLVFMDMDMPIINGVEATRYINQHFRGIIVIAVSLNSELADIQQMLEAGARNYIIKEKINKEYIESLLEKY
jgi:CheY-like chemotaxis protein